MAEALAFDGPRRLACLAVLLVPMLGLAFSGWAIGARGDAEKTRRLVALLQSDADVFDKARACRQLAEIGTPAAVPALAALLGDQRLSAYARSGLEGIADETAAQALRSAVPNLSGRQLAGVIDSLAVLKDRRAVPVLVKVATDPRLPVAAEACAALGRIATQPAVRFLSDRLAGAATESRVQAAAGLLLASEELFKQRKMDAARQLFDRVRSAAVPVNFRAAATRGAILARETGREEFVVQELRSTELPIRQAALLTIREIPTERLADLLNREIAQANAELQIQIIQSLGACHNAESLKVLRSKVEDATPALRHTALAVLAQIAGPLDADVLLRALGPEYAPEDWRIASTGLRRIESAEIESMILADLASVRDPGCKIRLIRLLQDRVSSLAPAEFLRQARDSDVHVSLAALQGLRAQGGAAELPALLDLIHGCQDPNIREAAESAASDVCARMGKPGAEAVFARFQNSLVTADRKSWVRILSSLGYAPALPSLEQLVDAGDELVANNVVEQLGSWPDPAPMVTLLRVAQQAGSPARRALALRSVIRLARAAAEEHQRPDDQVAAWFESAAGLATTLPDQKLIISGLGQLKTERSLRLLASYLRDQELLSETSVALVQIAPGLIPFEDGPVLREALAKVGAEAPNPQVRAQAEKVVRSLSAEKRVTLFDGRSLAGWEGDTNVWRVADGAIVGGSLAGNPRNEFLATTRSYTNFDLRLEYRLRGTDGFINSGVQFHSVRVKQPPNEMSGYQADIGAGYSGCLYDESRRNKFLARAAEDQVRRLEHPGDWNAYEVRCQGPRIEIRLNGERTVEYTEADASFPQTGLIGLQIHGGSKAEVRFRNITITELP